MNSNKNFVASLIASVASFVALPLSFYWFYTAIEMISSGFSFLILVLMILFALAVAIIAMETVALVLGKKGKELGFVYNLIVMILNALFTVLAIVAFILFIVDFGAFDFEVFVIFCMYFLPVLFAGAANGTAFGFKLFNLLKK